MICYQWSSTKASVSNVTELAVTNCLRGWDMLAIKILHYICSTNATIPMRVVSIAQLRINIVTFDKGRRRLLLLSVICCS